MTQYLVSSWIIGDKYPTHHLAEESQGVIDLSGHVALIRGESGGDVYITALPVSDDLVMDQHMGPVHETCPICNRP